MHGLARILRWPGLALLLMTAGFSAASESQVPVPEIVKARGKQCVEPSAVMRRDHMRFLLHQRDETVHRGIRSKRYSLRECIACHAADDAQGRAIPVNAAGQFCAGCHAYAGVRIDCFECHATTPGVRAASAAAAVKQGLSGWVGRIGDTVTRVLKGSSP